ncbi:MAG: ATP-binding protein [Cyanophyceae cyanobacterium]
MTQNPRLTAVSASPIEPQLQVLILHNCRQQAEAIASTLEEARYTVRWRCVATEADYRVHLGEGFDLIIADFALAQLTVKAALLLKQAQGIDIPFIIVNGSPSVPAAVEYMQAGATDYLIAEQSLPLAVHKALAAQTQQLARPATGSSEAQLQTIITENADGIIVVDAQRQVQFINAAALELLSRHADELLGQPFGFPVVGSDFLEVDLLSRTGEYRVAQMRVANIQWQGNPAYLVSLRDITDLKRAEHERSQLLEQAQTANRAKDEFLAILSHELRTPLNLILGWTQLLRRREFDRAQAETALETIERNATLQVQLIEDLLDISRIVRGKLTLAEEIVDLPTVIAGALETTYLAAKAKSIHLNTNIDANVGLVNGDPMRLQQVIWNLLSNAVKFTPDGGQVDISLSTVGSQVRIQVSDTGKGIAPEFLPHVFDYFRQADSSSTRDSGGLGLGLAIVRHLVELHGGRVSANSPGLGQGATFTVMLPIAAAKPPQNQQTASEKTTNFRGRRILVVDDEPDACELLVFALGQEGAIVKGVTSGAEALETLKPFQPELLISDVAMVGMDGYELIKKVRALASAKELPALSLTAFASETDEKRSLAAGFDRHLSKPVEIDKLIDVVAQLLNK